MIIHRENCLVEKDYDQIAGERKGLIVKPFLYVS